MDQSRYGTIGLAAMLGRDGYSLLAAMHSGELPLPPIYQTLGMEMKLVERGRVVVSAFPHRRFYSPIDTVHVGFTSGVMEAALISAVISLLDKGEICVPVEFKVNLVRPMSEATGQVEAIGTALYRGRTVATAEGKLVDAAGKLYAHATATCTVTTPGEQGAS